jgi:hypothetical protein
MTDNLTVRQLLLVLDAAVVAAEYPGVPRDVRAACDLLAEALGPHLAVEDGPFDKFLADQAEAVHLLAANPQVFGGEP